MYGMYNVGINANGKPSSKVLQPPGGQSSDIFGTRSPVASTPGSFEGSLSGSASGFSSGASTPTNGGSAPGSRRGSRSEDTKNRLFGPPDESQRKVKDHLRSSIFATETDSLPRGSAKKNAVRRNPITGEVYLENGEQNGHNGCDTNGANGTANGSNGNATNGTNGSNGSTNGSGATSPAPQAVITAPFRVRQPPGGRSSGIF